MADDEKILENAKALYGLSGQATSWDKLTKAKQTPYVNIARGLADNKDAILADLVSDYAGCFGASTKTQKLIHTVIGIILGAAGALGLMGTSGCGHTVDVTPDQTTICKDGSCLVIEQGHMSFRQNAPENTAPPIVVQDKK